jgi:hypothetical protein
MLKPLKLKLYKRFNYVLSLCRSCVSIYLSRWISLELFLIWDMNTFSMRMYVWFCLYVRGDVCVCFLVVCVLLACRYMIVFSLFLFLRI